MRHTLRRRAARQALAPRLVALMLLLIGASAAQAIPMTYAFDLGVAGNGSFAIKPAADAPSVVVNELQAFAWNIPGVGGFDLADLFGFVFGGWDPISGPVANANGLLAMSFTLKTNTASDTGVVCVTCTASALFAPPGTSNRGAVAQAVVFAAGTPCTQLGNGICAPSQPRLAAVPEPSTVSLAVLALLGGPLLRRKFV